MNLHRSVRGNRTSKAAGFTLVQLLLVVSLVALLALISMGLFRGYRVARERAYQARCDVQFKQILLAIDTYRQERGKSPANLNQLVTEGYLGAETLKCSADPDLAANAANPSYDSYDGYYVVRDPRDSGDLPILLCPFHEKYTSSGEQGYKAGYSEQYEACHPSIALGAYSGGLTVTRPGDGILSLPTSAASPLLLRGGDEVRTSSGTVTIHFTDNSAATLQPETDVRILESFIEGTTSGPLYNLVRQFSGKVAYYVNSGSYFDVATPTVTAGAIGTRFSIEILPSSEGQEGQMDTVLTVREHAVALSSDDYSVFVTDTDPPLAASDMKTKSHIPRSKNAGAFNHAGGNGNSKSGGNDNGNGAGNGNGEGNGNGKDDGKGTDPGKATSGGKP